MYEIESPVISEEFADCWHSARKHIDTQGDAAVNWLNNNLYQPSLAHLSFRLGNQLFFVRLEDVDRKLRLPGNPSGLFQVANGCRGFACIMPMQKRHGAWSPYRAGWGLFDAQAGRDVDPPSLISGERIEMTDWEVHDFGVQIVRQRLEQDGRQILSCVDYPGIDPAIWLKGSTGHEWVIVRAARHPAADPQPPQDWPAVAEHCRKDGTVGYFASVVLASVDDAFHPSMPPEPLWRGHGVVARFGGLKRLQPKGWRSWFQR